MVSPLIYLLWEMMGRKIPGELADLDDDHPRLLEDRHEQLWGTGERAVALAHLPALDGGLATTCLRV